MITYRWPSYVAQTLPRLLATCREDVRVWIWHNGEDEQTLKVVRSFATHPRVAAFHHSPDNQRLRAPTNWLWEHATGEFLGKVDDDCLVSDGWVELLRRAHDDEPALGVIGSWRFPDEDFVPSVAAAKITTVGGGHRLLRNPWVQGSGYLMKRRCVEDNGLLRDGQSFTSYCIELAAMGYVNGWYYPFVREEHLDDPRSPLTGLRTETDFQDRFPLTARLRGIGSLAQWDEENRRSAYSVQSAHQDPRFHRGWRRRLRSRIYWLNRRILRRGAQTVRYSGMGVARMPGTPSWEQMYPDGKAATRRATSDLGD